MTSQRKVSRRSAMTRIGLGCSGLMWVTPELVRAADKAPLSSADNKFLDELERACALFFWECADPTTGLVKDRSKADGPDPREVASIAATGFGLTALCIAAKR